MPQDLARLVPGLDHRDSGWDRQPSFGYQWVSLLGGGLALLAEDWGRQDYHFQIGCLHQKMTHLPPGQARPVPGQAHRDSDLDLQQKRDAYFQGAD